MSLSDTPVDARRETRTCAKCTHCRIRIAAPTGNPLDHAIVSPATERGIHCAKGYFDGFVTLKEFNASSVKRRAEICADYDSETPAFEVASSMSDDDLAGYLDGVLARLAEISAT